MNNVDTNDKQINIHTRIRNKLLFQLHQAYQKNLHYDSLYNASKDNEDLCSPDIEDLVLEMNEKKLSNFEKNNDMICYRCKHLINVPSNLFEVSEKLANYAEEYEADLNFVQAIVWLKSAIRSMKDVSIEQYYLIFHKQWNNIQNTREDSEHQIITAGTDDQENSGASDSDSEYHNNIDLLSNVKSTEILDLSQSGHRQQSKSDDRVSIGNSSSTFYSPSNSEKSLNTQNFTRNEPILKCRIIADSDETHSSISDMFSDSVDNKVNNNSTWNKDQKLHKINLIVDNSIEELSLLSQNNINLQKEFLEPEHNLVVASNENNSSLTSDSTIFDGECSFQRQDSDCLCGNDHECVFESCKQINIQQSQVSDSNLHNKNYSLSLNQIDNDIINSLQKDSAYDTCQLHAECTPLNDILQNEDSNILFNQEIAVITPYRKDNSVHNTDDLENITTNVIDRDWISGEYNLSGHYRNDENINQIKSHCAGNQDMLSCSENEYSQKEIDISEDKEHESGNNKKKRLQVTHEMEGEIPETKKRFLERDLKEKEEKKISSEWLRFTLNALHADDVAFQSVTVILSVLQNEKIAKQYMKKKCWKNTLEEQAVDAVLSFCEVFEAENKTTACTQEIIQAVTNTLNKSIENTELNQVTILTYHVSIILELCNSAKICTETINYLIDKLKSYESILIGLTKSNKADVYDTINQLHILLYALNICLQKYWLIFLNEEHSQFVEETVLSITDLWKKQLTCEDVIIEDKAEIRERRWLIVLNDFMVISVENCSLFVDKLQMLINLITRR
ncbi:uncharacterized protein LOC105663375 [Megachile rotundata]|uniref:uncharacterized protein LOC105663375 n=1 Tax=Megachile rotundata TaxID=143995 RepID=UPI003FD5356A